MKARELALNTIIDIIENKSYNNLILKKLFKENEMSIKDRAFITEIVNGTLRNIIFIDYIIDKFSKTKTTKMKSIILNILRVSVYQIKFMDKVPVSAVCNEAVDIIKKGKYKGLSGFVNGVLRNIAREIDKINLTEIKDPVDFLAIRYSYQKWTIIKLLEQMDYERLKKICEINSLPPDICICINTNKTTQEKIKKSLQQEGIETKDAELSPKALYISKTKNIAKSQSFKKGEFHVMGENSMIAIDALNIEKGDTVIDVCASPGGKSFYASYIMEDTGNVMARDLYPHKQQIMQNSIKRLGLKNVDIQIKDATINYDEDEEIADKLILDVPCSGFGIIRKKPDIKYTKTEQDIKELVKIQRDILIASHKYVKRGGVLLYSTCTLFDEENIDNVLWFCQNFEFELMPIELNLPEYIDTMKKGYINIMPDTFGTDGFFIAKLKRVN